MRFKYISALCYIYSSEDTGNIYTVPFKYLAMSFLEHAPREKEWVKNQNKGVSAIGSKWQDKIKEVTHRLEGTILNFN